MTEFVSGILNWRFKDDRFRAGSIPTLRAELGVKTAVITNGSLTWWRDVREDLMGADWVSLKVDSVEEEVWRRINRPHGMLQLRSMLDGTLEFAKACPGDLMTETMLVEGLNDSDDCIGEVADFLARLQPDRAYVSIPTRPPAEEWARPPEEEVINRAYQIVSEKVDHVEYLIGHEGNVSASTGNVEEDLLSITAVHPMREDAVGAFLVRPGASWAVARRLVAHGQLVDAEYGDHRFYLRRVRKRSGAREPWPGSGPR